jgi:hypothetical protein
LPERVAPRRLGGEELEILGSKFEMSRGLGAGRSPETLDDGGSDGVTREGLGGGGLEPARERRAGEDDWTVDGSGDDFIAGGDSDVRSAVLVNRSAGDGPLTPTLPRRERESDLGQAAGDGPLSPTLARGERESDLGQAAELAGQAPDDLTTADDGTHPQNDTNEAKPDDEVSTSESQEIDRLMSEIDDYLGLDTRETKPTADGGESGCASRRPTDGERGETGLAARSREREEQILEMERWLFKEIETLKSQGEPTGDLLNEMMAASANLHAYLEAYHSRSP